MTCVGRVIDEVEVVEDQHGPGTGDGRQFADECRECHIPARAGWPGIGQQRSRRRREGRIVLAARGDEVVQQRDPIAVVWIEPIPQRAQPRPSRKVRKECRLSVSGISQEEDDPAMDLQSKPVEKTRSLERLVAECRTLDLRDLDRVAAAFVAQVGTPGRRRPGDVAPTYGDRWSADDLRLRRARVGGRERYRPLARRVNGAERGPVGHGRHGGARRSTTD
jgi:hypothetical protein